MIENEKKFSNKDVLAHDIALFFDQECKGYILPSTIANFQLKEGIKRKKIQTTSNKIFSVQLFEEHWIRKNDKDIIPLNSFEAILKEYFSEENLEELRLKFYSKKFYIFPSCLCRILLWQRKNIALSDLEKSRSIKEVVEKDFISAFLRIFNCYSEAADLLSDIILLFQIYDYSSRPSNIQYSSSFTLIFTVRLIAICSPYLFCYSSGIHLILSKDVYLGQNYSQKNWIIKFFLYLYFTFIAPLYFLLLNVFDLLNQTVQALIIIFVPIKCGYFKLVKKTTGLIQKLGFETNDYEGILNQKGIVQLMFQDTTVLLFDSLLIAGVITAPGVVEESWNTLIVSYCLTIFNLFKQMVILKITSSYFKEDFLRFALFSMKAKIGWIPFLHKIKNDELTNIIDFHQIKCPVPLFSQMIGYYIDFKYNFSDITIRQLVSSINISKNLKKEKKISQEVKVGKCLSRVSLSSFGNLLSSSLGDFIKIDFGGLDLNQMINLSKPQRDRNGYWEALTALRESMVIICVQSEDKTEFRYKEILINLLEAKANPNSHDLYGTTPLIFSIRNQKPQSIRILLEKGADPNVCSENGNDNALFAAISSMRDDCLEIIDLLFKFKADPHIIINTPRGKQSLLMLMLRIIKESVYSPEITQKQKVFNHQKMEIFIENNAKITTIEERCLLLQTLALGHTQEGWAEITGGRKLLKLLPKGESLEDMRDENGNTFLHLLLGYVDDYYDMGNLDWKKMALIPNSKNEKPFIYVLKNMKGNFRFILGLAQKFYCFDQEMLETIADCIANDENKRNLAKKNLPYESLGPLSEIYKRKTSKDLYEKPAPNPKEDISSPAKKMISQSPELRSPLIPVIDNENIPFNVEIESPRSIIWRAPKKKEPMKDKKGRVAKPINLIEIILIIVLETISVFDFATDVIVLIQLIYAKHIAWSAISILTMLASYMIGYSPLISIFIERETFEKTNNGTCFSRYIRRMLGFLLMTPLSLSYFITLDLFFSIIEIGNSAYHLLILLFCCKRGFKNMEFEEWIDKFLQKLFYLNTMDTKGLRRMRTITQMIFESIPQIILQIRIISYSEDESLGVTLSALGLSLSLAILHLLFEIFLLILEKSACKCSIQYYSLICMNARLNWIPFIEKISRSRQLSDSKVYDYDNIKYQLCGKGFNMEYKFYNSTLETLSYSISFVPMVTNEQNQMEIKLGSSCSFIDLNSIQLLMIACKNKVKLDLKGIEWPNIFIKTFNDKIPPRPISPDGEYTVVNFMKQGIYDAVKYLLESGCDASINSLIEPKYSEYNLINLAIEYNQPEILDFLLKLEKINVLQIFNNEGTLKRIIAKSNLNLLNTFISSPRVSLSKENAKKIINIVLDLVKKNTNYNYAFQTLQNLGGLDIYYDGKTILEKAKKEGLTHFQDFYKEFSQLIPTKIWILFQDNVVAEFKTSIILNIKLFRSIFLAKLPLENNSEKKPYSAANYEISSKAFINLYNFLMSPNLSTYSEKDLIEMDSLVETIGLDDNVFRLYVLSTESKRCQVIFNLKSAKKVKMSCDSQIPIPNHLCGVEKMFLYKKLQTVVIPKNVMLIKSIHLQGSVEDQGWGNSGFCGLVLHSSLKSDAFFTILKIIHRESGDHCGQQDLIIDSKELDILNLPVSNAVLELYLRCPIFPGFSATCADYNIKISCLKRIEAEGMANFEEVECHEGELEKVKDNNSSEQNID